MPQKMNWVNSSEVHTGYDNIDFLCVIDDGQEYRFYWVCTLNSDTEPNSFTQCNLIWDFQTYVDTSNWKIIKYCELENIY